MNAETRRRVARRHAAAILAGAVALAVALLAGCAPAWTDARQADAERAYTCDPAGTWPDGPPAWRDNCEVTP